MTATPQVNSLPRRDVLLLYASTALLYEWMWDEANRL